MVLYTVLSGDEGKRKLYDTLWRKFYWAHMANDAHTTVADCQTFAAQGTRTCYEMKLRPFPVARRFEFVMKELLGPSP